MQNYHIVTLNLVKINSWSYSCKMSLIVSLCWLWKHLAHSYLIIHNINYSMALADELFECVWLFCGFGAYWVKYASCWGPCQIFMMDFLEKIVKNF